jgi:hypothetical protein
VDFLYQEPLGYKDNDINERFREDPNNNEVKQVRQISAFGLAFFGLLFLLSLSFVCVDVACFYFYFCFLFLVFLHVGSRVGPECGKPCSLAQ